MATTRYNSIAAALMLAVLCGSATSFLCPTDYYAIESRCYLFETRVFTWEFAEANCVLLGGSLAQTLDQDTHAMAALVSYLQVHPELNHTNIWIGGSDINTEGQFRWTNGDRISMSPLFWHSFEPNGGNGSNCLDLRFSGVHLFGDAGCTTKYPSICSAASMPLMT